MWEFHVHFTVFFGQKCCVNAHFHVPPIISAGLRDTCMNPDVVFTVFKIVFFIPRINLIKIFITHKWASPLFSSLFYLDNFNADDAIKMKMWDIATSNQGWRG